MTPALWGCGTIWGFIFVLQGACAGAWFHFGVCVLLISAVCANAAAGGWQPIVAGFFKSKFAPEKGQWKESSGAATSVNSWVVPRIVRNFMPGSQSCNSSRSSVRLRYTPTGSGPCSRYRRIWEITRAEPLFSRFFFHPTPSWTRRWRKILRVLQGF